MYQIEKNIPVPQSRGRGGAPSLYPLREMEVGDSFLVPSADGIVAETRAMVYASQYGKRNEKKFSSRKTDEGRRIWRVA